MKVDALVVGAGILGLGHALAAEKTGRRVWVCERSRRPQGASIRNFGMLWPIGQSTGDGQRLALRARQIWDELSLAARIDVQPCGSIFVAHHDDEMRVLEEFHASKPQGLRLQLLSPDEVLVKSPHIVRENLQGGLFSETEARVYPPQAINELVDYLEQRPNVEFRFDTTITKVEPGKAVAASGEEFWADKIVVCSGADFAALLPQEFASASLKKCKLQMMRTVAQPDGWQLGPHVASGLTLRHYPAFDACPSIQQVRGRIAEQSPELDQFGIHVMASQAPSGELIIGDSHEYGDQITPFNSQEIDDLIIREISKILDIARPEISTRWSGVYLKKFDGLFHRREVLPAVEVVNGVGGNGMTLSLALAEQTVADWGTT